MNFGIGKRLCGLLVFFHDVALMIMFSANPELESSRTIFGEKHHIRNHEITMKALQLRTLRSSRSDNPSQKVLTG